jgi:hypothetical protein
MGGFVMKRFEIFFTVAAFGLLAITWFAAKVPASDRTQLSQVNIQALMENAHDLTDTTPAIPY